MATNFSFHIFAGLRDICFAHLLNVESRCTPVHNVAHLEISDSVNLLKRAVITCLHTTHPTTQKYN